MDTREGGEHGEKIGQKRERRIWNEGQRIGKEEETWREGERTARGKEIKKEIKRQNTE